MPSARKQFNIRPDDEMWELVERLKGAVRAALGLNVSYSDLFRLGMLELARKYLGGEAPGTPSARSPAAGGEGTGRADGCEGAAAPSVRGKPGQRRGGRATTPRSKRPNS